MTENFYSLLSCRIHGPFYLCYFFLFFCKYINHKNTNFEMLIPSFQRIWESLWLKNYFNVFYFQTTENKSAIYCHFSWNNKNVCVKRSFKKEKEKSRPIYKSSTLKDLDKTPIRTYARADTNAFICINIYELNQDIRIYLYM